MTDILRHRSAQRHGQTNGAIDVDPIQAHVDMGAFPQRERSMRRRLHALTGVLFLSMLLPCQAHAQIYELIKWCKGNWRTVVVCVVVEKGVERVVEKSIDEWAAQWKKGEGKVAPPTPAPSPDKGMDFRTLMRDYERFPVGSLTMSQMARALAIENCRTKSTSSECFGSEFCAWHENTCKIRGSVPQIFIPCEVRRTASECSGLFLCVWHENKCGYGQLTAVPQGVVIPSIKRSLTSPEFGEWRPLCAIRTTESGCNLTLGCQWSGGACMLTFN